MLQLLKKICRLIGLVCSGWAGLVSADSLPAAGTVRVIPVKPAWSVPVVNTDTLPRVIKIQIAKTTIPKDTVSGIGVIDGSRGRRYLSVYPGDIIRFTISNPRTFLKVRPTDRSAVIVYINGIPLKGITTGWESGLTNMQISAGKMPLFGKAADIDILLRRNDTTKDAWNFLYKNTPAFYTNYVKVDASIGWEDMSALEKAATIPEIKIIYYEQFEFYSWVGFFIILLSGFAYLGFFTNAIRDGDITAAYSLSQTQLLFWTTLVIGGFIYTLLLTAIPSSLNTSILFMLGISLTTTGAAVTIDSRPDSGSQLPKKQHRNFFNDVLTTDGSSYSVQRIQTFAWNLVLGIYFIIYTIDNKSMPVFSSTLLFLAGFTSLSYLGSKPPENTMLKKLVHTAEESKTATGSDQTGLSTHTTAVG